MIPKKPSMGKTPLIPEPLRPCLPPPLPHICPWKLIWAGEGEGLGAGRESVGTKEMGEGGPPLRWVDWNQDLGPVPR